MDYCGPRGIPRSLFLGRPYPKPGEPLWLEEDTNAALAWQAEDAAACPGCGLPLDETSSEDDSHLFESAVVRCFACEAKQTNPKARELADRGEAAGLLLTVHRSDGDTLDG